MSPDSTGAWRPSGIVTLLTDFGTAGPYVAAMKGVLLDRAPGLRAIVDVSHEVPPQDLAAAAFVLDAAWSWFPTGTVHVVVVDPEVGTARDILVAERDGHALVAPDNGVLAPLVESASGGSGAIVRRVDPARAPRVGGSATFHGRDRFAPLAAHLAGGASPESVGQASESWRRLSLPEARAEPDGSLVAQVLLVDRFGNLITSARREQLGDARWSFERGGRRAELARTYAEVEPGELVCVVDSHDRLEIAVRDGDAASELGLVRGAEVRLVRDAGGGGR